MKPMGRTTVIHLDPTVGPYGVTPARSRVLVRTIEPDGSHGWYWLPVEHYVECFDDLDRGNVRVAIADMPVRKPSWLMIALYPFRYGGKGLRFAWKLIKERRGIATC